MEYTKAQIASTIDHALLKPDMDREALKAGLDVAIACHTASACVRGCDVAFAAE